MGTIYNTWKPTKVRGEDFIHDRYTLPAIISPVEASDDCFIFFCDHFVFDSLE